jgi:hypothetical protein
MGNWFTATVTDWEADHEKLRRGRYGIIETAAGQLVAVHFRPLPKLLSWPEVWPVGDGYHAGGESDRCYLYFNQPWRFPNFIALKYIVSTHGAGYASFRAALAALDRLAELKAIDALLCDAANTRISDRLLERFGWAPHKPQHWRRNYIKRFYGVYPSASKVSF